MMARECQMRHIVFSTCRDCDCMLCNAALSLLQSFSNLVLSSCMHLQHMYVYMPKFVTASRKHTYKSLRGSLSVLKCSCNSLYKKCSVSTEVMTFNSCFSSQANRNF